MNQRQKRIVKISYILYYILLVAALFICYHYRIGNLKMGAVAAFTCFLVPGVLKLCRLKAIFEIYMVNIIFAAVASIAGSMLGAYSIPYFDKLLHFSSGIFMSELVYMLFCCLKKDTCIYDKNERILSLLFVNAGNMMIAVYWEFFEYGCLIFLNNDAINHYTSGVHDSMSDMLVALLGGMIIMFSIMNYYKKGKKNFWIRLNQHFYDLNFNS